MLGYRFGSRMYSLVHLHLIFSGLVCILSLQGRQEHCPFTTRLRVLKLARNERSPARSASFSCLCVPPPHARKSDAAWLFWFSPLHPSTGSHFRRADSSGLRYFL